MPYAAFCKSITGSAGNPNAAVVSVQGVAGGTVLPVGGSVASGATYGAGVLPVYTGGFASNTAPTAVTTGQTVKDWSSLIGAKYVTLTRPDGGAFANIQSPGNGQATVQALSVQSFNMKHNGASFDLDRKPSIFSRLTASAATGSPTSVKTSAGDICTWWGQNGAAITYLQLYNKASAPVLGTDTPLATFPIPANASFSPPSGFAGAYFPLGIAFAFTTDVAGASAAAVNAVTSFLMAAA